MNPEYCTLPVQGRVMLRLVEDGLDLCDFASYEARIRYMVTDDRIFGVLVGIDEFQERLSRMLEMALTRHYDKYPKGIAYSTFQALPLPDVNRAVSAQEPQKLFGAAIADVKIISVTPSDSTRASFERIRNAKVALMSRPGVSAASWLCVCGHVNQGRFCMECGGKKPDSRQCANCRWKCPEDGKEPNFCPECGNPFGTV